MRAEPSIRIAFAAACIALLSGAVAFRAVAAAVNAWVLKEPVPLREPFATIPATLGVWKSISGDTVLPDTVLESLGTNVYLDRVYAVDGDPRKGFLQVHLAYYTGLIDRVPHVPERCFVAGGYLAVGSPDIRPVALDDSGWRTDDGPVNVASGQPYRLATVVDPISRARTEVPLPIGEAQLTVVEFQDPAKPEHRALAGYFFVANGRLTPRAGDVRALSYSLSERYAYFCKVQFTAHFKGDDAKFEQFEAHVADLLQQLLPHLMRRLPDWREFERRHEAPEPST